MPIKLPYKPVTVDLPENRIGSATPTNLAGKPKAGMARVPTTVASRAGNIYESVGSPARARINDVIKEAQRGFRELGDRSTRPLFDKNKRPLGPMPKAMVGRMRNNAAAGLLGRAVPVIGAGQAGYDIGSEIYKRNAPEILDGIESVTNALSRKR